MTKVNVKIVMNTEKYLNHLNVIIATAIIAYNTINALKIAAIAKIELKILILNASMVDAINACIIVLNANVLDAR